MVVVALGLLTTMAPRLGVGLLTTKVPRLGVVHLGLAVALRLCLVAVALCLGLVAVAPCLGLAVAAVSRPFRVRRGVAVATLGLAACRRRRVAPRVGT